MSGPGDAEKLTADDIRRVVLHDDPHMESTHAETPAAIYHYRMVERVTGWQMHMHPCDCSTPENVDSPPDPKASDA